MYTTNPIYTKPLLPKITFTSLDKSSVYYTYDPFTDSGTSSKPLYCSVQPASPNHQGQFTVQIEDQTGAISQGVNLNARCTIDCGKQSSQMTRLISGLVRQTGYSRGADGKRLYTLSGSSTGIRLNERITYQVREARKLAQDGITPDPTDPAMKADTLLATIFALGGYPSAEAIDTTSIEVDSDVENFVPSIAVEYGQLQDAANLLEEYTGADIYVDVDDAVIFRHPGQPFTKGRGFTITNKKRTNDGADDTMYLVGKNWDFTESMLTSDSYSNEIFSILPAETDINTSDRSQVGLGPSFNDRNQFIEVAQKFSPPHSRFLPGDIYIAYHHHIGRDEGATIPSNTIDLTWDSNEASILSNTRTVVNAMDTSGGQKYVWRIVGPDTSNTPNSLPVVANIVMYPSNFSYPGGGGTSATAIVNDQDFVNSGGGLMSSFVLDTSKNYWLILSDDNSTIPSAGAVKGYWAEWVGRTSVPSATVAQASAGASSNSSAGGGWSRSTDQAFWFAMPRRRSQSFVARDTKAISAMSGGTTRAGLIESTLSGLPSTVKTQEALQKYMAQQLYFMARPRMNFNMGKVTAPNIPPLPGDPIMISDSVLGFSTGGNRVVMTTCGDMTYSWGNLGSGNYEAPTFLSIQPVGLFTGYRDPS